MARYSIIIKNGVVFDGAGNKPEVIDIGIEGEEIVKIGNLQNDRARIVIDAAGRYVSPGFIDLSTHSDTHWSIFLYPLQESFLRQGITTILGGNCGFSLAPFLGTKPIEEIGAWVNLDSVNIDWQTMEEFLAELENHPLGVNFGTLVGLNTVFHSAKTASGSKEKEMSAIEYLVGKSIDEGAFGVSMNMSLDDMQNFTSEDAIHIAKIVEHKNGLLKHHLKNEGREILPSVSKTVTLARESGARSHITHFRSLGKSSWESFSPAIEIIKRAREEGVKISCDFYPYTNTDSELLFILPSWARKKTRAELREILSSKEKQERAEIIKHIENLTLHYDAIFISSGRKEYDLLGKNLLQASKELDLSPEETIIRLLLAEKFSTRIFNEAVTKENIEKIISQPFASFASDGVGYDRVNYPVASDKSDMPHPRSFGCYPYTLSNIVREQSLLSWEEAIRKMTSLPASTMGLKNRGNIKKGMKADIVVINPTKLKAEPNYTSPFQNPEGIEHVIVNGVMAIEEGNPTGAYAGVVLRKE